LNKIPKHNDIDADLWPGLNINPFRLFWRLGCIASVMIFIVSWLALIAVAATGWVDLAFWHFITLPISAWLLLLAWPILRKSRRGALGILDAIIMTCEAWMARAGYSIDLNNDGRIGHYQPVIQPPIVEERRAIPYRVNGEAKLLAHQVATGPVANDEPAAAPLTRHVWTLPNGAKVEQSLLEDFSDRLSIAGLGRAEWVGRGKPLERDQYEGLMTLLEQGGIVEGRRKGFGGKLVVKSAAQRRRVLGLPLGAVAKGNEADRLDAGNFQHIQ
jgi:hypothetical protein